MHDKNTLGSLRLAEHGFARLLGDIELTCLDVGARGGFTSDLLPIAPAVRAIGFEPDREECHRLNDESNRAGPWRDLRFVSVALGKATETRRLNIYRKRGCSSLVEADIALASRFGRAGYYLLDGTVEVPTTTADAAASQYEFEDAAFFKLDVQGAELEILNGSQRLLRDALVALRIEVSFLPIYRNQPLFSDIDHEMRKHEFFPMRFLELHPWRRFSKAKLPQLDNGAFPYSQGQLIHGDVLYMRNAESLPESDDAAVERLIRAALIALAYGLIDHAMAICERPAVKVMLISRFGIEPLAAISAVSRHLARDSGIPLATSVRQRLRKLLRGRV